MTGRGTAKPPVASAGPADAALPRLLTVGHSNRELNEFIELLTGTGTEVVVDVRKLPGSTKNPWFNADTLESDLAEVGFELRRLEGLTGRRPVSRTVPFDVNAWWQNRSFHNYADHCLSSAFRTDLETLIGWSTEARCAILCSEAVWWRCHRRILADQLLARDLPVAHVLGQGHIDAAKLSEGARIEADGTLTYPADS
ncbi:DUF488 domain-containing protein [Brevibacterium permense]|uniref:DUF488 domain-containing protein n=1 Tax=Brevibacterium permense TaxID=234834 RepID=UPI0021D1B593|nr:DUF488 domain-containing protein [Brevibacterium permense]MCU4297272.1 DUF488 domain-containing protein [Brevibacterium permense]